MSCQVEEFVLEVLLFQKQESIFTCMYVKILLPGSSVYYVRMSLKCQQLCWSLCNHGHVKQTA